ncbi:hypothetical protein Chor_013610 [Crotalus horridus]
MSFLVRPWVKRDALDVVRLVRVQNSSLSFFFLSALSLTQFAAPFPPAGHTIVGYQFHYLSYCTWDGPVLFGEDLYVMPEFRGRGVGTALLNRACKIALEKGCSQFRFISAEKHQTTTGFYHKKGAVNVTDRDTWHVFRIDRDPLAKLVGEAAAKPNPVSSQL